MNHWLIRTLGLLLVGGLGVAADWQFRSRPDLSPPRLNITVPANVGAVDKGLIFVAPNPGSQPGSTGPIQHAPYIFRDDGELVWSGIGYVSGWTANFRPDFIGGKPVLRAFEGQMSAQLGLMHGHYVVLNQQYEQVKTIKAGSHRLISAHEFQVINGSSVLIEVPIVKHIDLTPWGADEEQRWIVSSGFQEIDLETGTVLFEWESLDHIDPKYSAFPIKKTNDSTGELGSGYYSWSAWDYFHLNSVDKDDEGNYLISGRNYAALFKINGTSGEVIWQLGGFHNGSTFELEPEARFAYQHDARFLNRSEDGTIETLSLFDNAAHSTGVRINQFSRARILQLNHTDGSAKALATYPAPDRLSAVSQGNAQVLPNGNVFTNWGEAGAITEFDSQGNVLFHAYLDSAPEGRFAQSYRGFRGNWTAVPKEDPAIVAFRGTGDEDIDIFVSWNGDTETKTWRFYVQPPGQGRDRRRLLGEAERTGFETRFAADGYNIGTESRILAEAVDADGDVLVVSAPVDVASFDGPPNKGSRTQLFDLSDEL